MFIECHIPQTPERQRRSMYCTKIVREAKNFAVLHLTFIPARRIFAVAIFIDILAFFINAFAMFIDTFALFINILANFVNALAHFINAPAHFINALAHFINAPAQYGLIQFQVWTNTISSVD